MKKTIYLAGPMLGYTFEEMNEWRNIVTKQLIDNYDIINPARRIYSEHEYKFIVEQDKKEIDICDILFVNHIISSDGTAMETIYAWERNKTILMVVNGIYSPWIKYHSNCIFDNIDAAVKFLNYDYLRGKNNASELRNNHNAVKGTPNNQM